MHTSLLGLSSNGYGPNPERTRDEQTRGIRIRSSRCKRANRPPRQPRARCLFGSVRQSVDGPVRTKRWNCKHWFSNRFRLNPFSPQWVKVLWVAALILEAEESRKAVRVVPVVVSRAVRSGV
jgi:hypothetical protein